MKIVDKIKYEPIGIIHSQFKESRGTPIQPTSARGSKGTVEVFPEYIEGLQDIETFSHIMLIYHFHLSTKSRLKVKPFMDDKLHGVFATRAPSRPNHIGISIVRLLKVKGHILYVSDVDILDGTPLLDIKPYVSEFDSRLEEKKGWLTKNIHKLLTSKDDGRFTK